MTVDLGGQWVRVCGDRMRVTDTNPGRDSVQVAGEIGGVHQYITVTEQYARSNLTDAP